MKTAQSIEAGEERKAQTAETVRRGRGPDLKPRKRRDGATHSIGKNPNSHTPRGFARHDNDGGIEKYIPAQWTPESPAVGRQRHDVAREIARAVFEKNKKKLYSAFARAALKGNAYAFSQLADRAYGKLKERVEFDVNEYRDVSDAAICERILELKAKLGLTSGTKAELGPAGGTSTLRGAGPVASGDVPPPSETQD